MIPHDDLNLTLDVAEHPGRVPPQALDVEEAVLGAVLLDETVMSRVIEVMDESCFYRESHRIIFSVYKRLFANHNPIDLITVTEELRKLNQLERVGGSFFLTGLSQKLPSAANIDHYVKTVYDKSRLRKLIQVGSQIVSMAFQETEDVDQLIDQVEQEVYKVSEDRSNTPFQEIKTILMTTLEQIEKYHYRSGATGVPSGYRSLDGLTSGFQNSDLIIVAGRPSMGKTALVLSIARNVTVIEKRPVGFFSLEMSSLQLVMRLLCAEAKVDAHKVRTGMLPNDDWPKLSTCLGRLSGAPLYIDDTAGLNVLELRARARRLKAEKNIELLIVDYLQLVSASTRAGANRQEEVAMISRSLKALAKELNIPIIALSQLSRAVEQRGGEKKPVLSDLRDSGSIEQDADVVMFVHRQDYYEQEELERKKDPVVADIIIGKQRNGPQGEVHLNFIKKYARFEEIETHHIQNIPPPSHMDEPAF